MTITSETAVAEAFELPDDDTDFYLPVDGCAPAPINGPTTTPLAPTAEVFEITTAEQAEFVLDRLNVYDERLARVDKNFAALTERYKAQRQKIEVEKAGYEALSLVPLEAWAKANRPAKGKTLKMLAGSITLKSESETFLLKDKNVLIEWASANAPTFVSTVTKTEQVLDTNGLKKHVLEQSLTEVPGFEHRPAFERLLIKGA